MGIFEENFEIHRSHFLLSSRILSVACSRLMLTVENRSFSALTETPGLAKQSQFEFSVEWNSDEYSTRSTPGVWPFRIPLYLFLCSVLTEI